MTREEAIEVYNGLINTKIKEAFEFFAPELADSEDERIRKNIVSIINQYSRICAKEGDSCDDINECLAWLEKQKEQKPVDEPFEEWIDGWYNEHHRDGYITMDEREFKNFCRGIRNMYQQKPAEWSEEDERIREEIIAYFDSEALTADETELLYFERWIAYLEKQKNCILVPKSHLDPVGELGVDGMKIMEGDNETETQKAYREGKNAGRKEVFDHPEYYGLQLRRMYGYETGKRNPAWSDEEEDMLNSCISSIEEAKENRYAYKETDGDTSYDYEIAWLKSLRPSWKPSKEQLEALGIAMDRNDSIGYNLRQLYEQLKKL